MDDAMYDMQTGSQDDGAGHEPVKRKPVRPAELRLDDSKENCVLASWRPLCERCFSAV